MSWPETSTPMNPQTPRLAASSYSNTAPLIWSFLYGSNHGKAELILDNAPSRSAELLGQRRVDAALTPVIAYQTMDDCFLVPDVCIGTKERVKSVSLVTRGRPLEDVRSVALDVSSKTSVCLTKIVFREFLGSEPEWRPAEPDIETMLAVSDCALLIGDPALRLAEAAEASADPPFQVHDLGELWHRHTGLGFIFAMWMFRGGTVPADFTAARDEGLVHIDEIASNYREDIGTSVESLKRYLKENISYSPDGSMLAGLELFFDLAFKNRLIDRNRPAGLTA